MINLKDEEIKTLIEKALEKSDECIKNNRFPEAEQILNQIIKIDPKCEIALRILTDVLMTQRKQEEAIITYEKILGLKPDDQVALNNVALCYAAVGETDKAIDNLNKCIRLHPDNPASHSNLALQFKDVGRYEEAQTTYIKGINHLPENHDLRFNYGVFLAEQLRFEEAIEQYRKAISIQPDFFLAHFNLGLLNLLLGNFEEGWKGYEWRFHNPAFNKFKARFQGPEWNGEDGQGKTILVYNEQGAGDAIQFVRYLPQLKKKGFKVVLEVVYELVDLMSQCSGVDLVIPQRSKHTPTYDYHVSIGSLPLKLRMLNPFSLGGYIKPTGTLNKEAFSHYDQFKKIGICWAGNPIHRHDNQRSCRLKDFKCLNHSDVKLFGLQKDSRPRFWAGQGVVDLTEGCEDMNVVDMSDLLINFNYTAAIMKCMECIVTVDTAVAHLAGAMNLPCYLLLHSLPDWRWGLNTDRSKWYESIHLIRQKTPGDYNNCLKSINKIINKV